MSINNDGAGSSPEEEKDRDDFPGWKQEHSVDYGDYLDAVMDPDDPLHEVARKAALGDPALSDWAKERSPRHASREGGRG